MMSKKRMNEGFNEIPTFEGAKVKKEKSGGMSAFLVFVIVLVAVVALLICIRMDVGHFGSKVLRPMIGDVPVISAVLPEKTDDEISEETGYRNLAQAVLRIRELEEEVDELKAGYASADSSAYSEADQEKINDLEKQIKKLKVYEKNQKTFENTKEEFYKEVVYNDNVNPEDYVKWYESMDADTAAKLYKEVIKTEEEDQERKDLAASYAAMKPAQAAKILEVMTADLDIVVSILNEMTPEQRGKIMGEMSSPYAAKVTKKMSS